MSLSSVPGYDVLGLNSNATPAASTSSSSSGSVTQNPYQQAYDSIETWSSSYLMRAIEYGAPAIPQFTGGQSVDAMAQLANTLGAMQAGVKNGTYGDGIGSTIDTSA